MRVVKITNQQVNKYSVFVNFNVSITHRQQLIPNLTHRKNDTVQSEIRMVHHESQCFNKTSLFKQGYRSEETGKHVDTKHHMHRRHPILLE